MRAERAAQRLRVFGAEQEVVVGLVARLRGPVDRMRGGASASGAGAGFRPLGRAGFVVLAARQIRMAHERGAVLPASDQLGPDEGGVDIVGLRQPVREPGGFRSQ